MHQVWCLSLVGVSMARRWKKSRAVLLQQPAPTYSDVDMIEKSIKKHEEKAYYNNSYNAANNGKNFWPKVKYDSHITEKQKLGFVLGAEVVTKYGIVGTIVSYKECPDEGVTFYGGNGPCCVYIKRSDGFNANNDMIYGFYELTLKDKA